MGRIICAFLYHARHLNFLLVFVVVDFSWICFGGHILLQLFLKAFNWICFGGHILLQFFLKGSKNNSTCNNTNSIGGGNSVCLGRNTALTLTILGITGMVYANCPSQPLARVIIFVPPIFKLGTSFELVINHSG